jgi:hypothetical protein
VQVAIALSILVAEVTAPPFNETVCTFSAQPQLHTIKGESLVEKVTMLLARLHFAAATASEWHAWACMSMGSFFLVFQKLLTATAVQHGHVALLTSCSTALPVV